MLPAAAAYYQLGWELTRNTLQAFLMASTSHEAWTAEDKEELTTAVRHVDEAIASRRFAFPEHVQLVVLEGLDGSGKSSIAQALVELLEGTRDVYDVIKLHTPGPPFQRHRSKFQSARAEERLAFYNASNYHLVLQAALMEQARADRTRPLVIVLDRWWISSLCGFCVEQRVDVENISDLGMWPPDLPRPARSSTVCITVEESARVARLRGRSVELTWQEKDLERDAQARAIARALYHQCQKQGCLQFVSNDTTLRDCVAAVIKLHFPNWSAALE